MANNATGLKYNNTGFLYSFRPEKIVRSIVFPVVLMEWGLNVDDSTQRTRISENTKPVFEGWKPSKNESPKKTLFRLSIWQVF